jgi:EAL domain-containing protein (putative c-di-GMP-specific phosphodiesterase class I)/GGDEF domain-containing protein
MEAKSAEHHISGIYTKMLVELLVETMSAGTIQDLFRRAGETRTLDELSDVGSWSSYLQFRNLLQERHQLDKKDLIEQADVLTKPQHDWEMSQSARTLGSPGELIAGGTDFNPLVPIRCYEKTEVASNEWVIREWFKDGFEPFPEFCDFVALQLRLIPVIFRLPPGDVTEETCQCRGDDSCTYRVRWHQLETDVNKAEQCRARAELAEVRLEQVQDMITALASNEEYEEILKGFVGSLLRTAVGASGALLVIEPRAGMPRAVYSEGFAQSDVDAIADDLLAGGIGKTNVMAVEVASARHHYGYLAVDQDGGVFLELAHATLQTYGRLAAAALDTANALEEARSQAKTAQVLLDLATSLTEIVSSQETAARVVRAVPDMIDCDRAAIFLNEIDPLGVQGESLSLAGSIGLSDEELVKIKAQPCDTAPADLVHEQGLERTTSSKLDSVASVAAPIIVAGQRIGFIVAGVTSGPERLAITPRLATRLKGLAAQASTAVANARLVEQIRFQAMHDALTGLPNRSLILDRAEQMLARARRADIQVAALFIDLDGFKDVNDDLGHEVGDQLLQVVAERLSIVMRGGDSIGRLGGDEFVVLVDGSSMDVGPEMVAERLLELLRIPFDLPTLPGPEMHTAVQDRHLLEMDLRDALTLRQYHLVYQPIFNLVGGQTTGFEALLRWDHPERGLVQPDTFIPVLEDSGMIVEVGQWVLEEACHQGAQWHASGYQIGVSVNVSCRQLETDELVNVVRTALVSSGFPASSLTLEITETAIMKNVGAVVSRLSALRGLGVRIAIDDFGTGYSSLAYLQKFPVDTLKIDRSFISTMAGSSESGTLIRTLVQLGKTLGLETVAEGIEETEQYAQLEREHCDSGQGFLYARPLEVEAVEEFLRCCTHDTTRARRARYDADIEIDLSVR